jgi:GT2 family glycosyltransferase
MITVVIPSFNRRDCVLRLLEDLRLQENTMFETIVVDDCSPDDSADAVRTAFPEVKLLVNETNGGPCVTRNRGVRAAQGDIIVGLDSDVTVPDRNFIAGIEAFFKSRPGQVGMALRIYDPDGGDDAPRWWHPVPIDQGRDRPFETHYFSGTAYAFRRDDMIAAGLFPEIFYMHYEEVELALRLMDLGVAITYHPEIGVIHHAAPTTRRNRIKVFFKPRNQILLSLRCFPTGRAIRYLVPRIAFNALSSVTQNYLGDYLSSLKSSLDLAPECLRQRNVVSAATWRRVASLAKQVP